MDCEKASILMMEYIDGTISEEDSMKLMRHIEKCDFCREEFSLLSDTIELIENVEEVEPPEELDISIMERIDTKLYKKRWKRPILIGLTAVSALALIWIFISNLWIPWIVGRVPNTGGIKEGIFAAIIDFVHFVVLTLPRILILIKRAFSFVSSIGVPFLGIATVLLLGLTLIEMYLIKLVKYNWEGK